MTDLQREHVLLLVQGGNVLHLYGMATYAEILGAAVKELCERFQLDPPKMVEERDLCMCIDCIPTAKDVSDENSV